jgi:hypothetical protein
MRCVAAGNFCSFSSGLRGRGSNSPPQFGQHPFSRSAEQTAQKVHSKEQIRASAELAGKS